MKFGGVDATVLMPDLSVLYISLGSFKLQIQ